MVVDLGPTNLGGGGFDRSGLVRAAYASVGVSLPRTSRQQWHAGPHIPLQHLQPGDLVFYAHNTADPATIHHGIAAVTLSAA